MNKRVRVSWTATEKFIRQMVNKLVNGFEVKSSVKVCDGGAFRIITNDSKTFRLENLKLTVVSRRCIAPAGGGIGEYRANQ
jgi:hypothetical protein